MALESILVVGATGKQGGAVIKALLSLPDSATRFRILALTRNTASPQAQALASTHPGVVDLVQGDATSPEPIFNPHARGSISALFLVTTPSGGSSSSRSSTSFSSNQPSEEEQQAIPLIDSAIAHGVRHIVFSSVDRGGNFKSLTNPTTVPHFRSKHFIEQYLRSKAFSSRCCSKCTCNHSCNGNCNCNCECNSSREAKQTANKSHVHVNYTWTILRPVAFMENMRPAPRMNRLFCAVFTAMWAAGLGLDRKLQLVSVRDLGLFAAKALSEPALWSGRAVGVAGDELTLAEARAVFGRVVGDGGSLPQAWTAVGRVLLWVLGEVGEMFRFFEREGYGVDIEAVRKEAPVMDFETWLKEESGWLAE